MAVKIDEKSLNFVIFIRYIHIHIRLHVITLVRTFVMFHVMPPCHHNVTKCHRKLHQSHDNIICLNLHYSYWWFREFLSRKPTFFRFICSKIFWFLPIILMVKSWPYVDLVWKKRIESCNKLQLFCDVINNVIMMSHTGNEKRRIFSHINRKNVDFRRKNLEATIYRLRLRHMMNFAFCLIWNSAERVRSYWRN